MTAGKEQPAERWRLRQLDDRLALRPPRTAAGLAELGRRGRLELWHPVDGRRAETLKAILAIEDEAGDPDTEAKVRRLLWEMHGHVGLYGDDGELQCSECPADYRRDPLARLVDRLGSLGAAVGRAVPTAYLDTPSPFARDVADELRRARRGHPPVHSLHEGHAVIAEELDEYWDEVRAKDEGRFERAYHELVQVGAMAQRTAEDVVRVECPICGGLYGHSLACARHPSRA